MPVCMQICRFFISIIIGHMEKIHFYRRCERSFTWNQPDIVEKVDSSFHAHYPQKVKDIYTEWSEGGPYPDERFLFL